MENNSLDRDYEQYKGLVSNSKQLTGEYESVTYQVKERRKGKKPASGSVKAAIIGTMFLVISLTAALPIIGEAIGNAYDAEMAHNAAVSAPYVEKVIENEQEQQLQEDIRKIENEESQQMQDAVTQSEEEAESERSL